MLTADGSRREPGALLLAAMLAIYFLTAGGSLATSDAVVTYDVTRQIVEHGSVALSSNLIGNPAYLAQDGRYYSPFGVLQAVWNIPFYLAGKVAHSVVPVGRVSPDMMTKATVALGNAVTAALVVWMIWLTARSAGASRRSALAAALMAGLCTSLWPYSKFGFNVPLSALLVTAIGYFSLDGARTGRASRLMMAGLMCGCALLTRHEFGLMAIASAILVAAARWRQQPIRALASWAFGAVPCAVIWGWYNFVRYGSPFDTGYMRDDTLGMGGSVLAGLFGLLLSPAASVFVYSPILIPVIYALWTARRRKPMIGWWLAGTTILFLLFYAQLGSWAGGRSYGPRYLVPFFPALCIPLALLLDLRDRRLRNAIVAVAVLSAAVQIPGVLVDFSKVRVDYAHALKGATYESRMLEWSASPLVLNVEASARAVPLVTRHLRGVEPKPAFDRQQSGQSRDFSQQFAFSVDAWWIYLFYLGVLPAWASLTAGFGLATAGVMMMLAAWRRAGRLDRGGPAVEPVSGQD